MLQTQKSAGQNLFSFSRYSRSNVADFMDNPKNVPKKLFFLILLLKGIGGGGGLWSKWGLN